MPGDILAHELANYLRGRTIVESANLHEIATKLFFHSYFECDIFPSH
jgi:hypothetical protein